MKKPEWACPSGKSLLSIAIIVVFFKYLKIVAPRLISDILFKIIFGLGIIISLIVIVSSNQLYNSMFIYGQTILGVLLIYLMYTILKGILKGNINYFITWVLFVSSIITYDINYFFGNLFWYNLHSNFANWIPSFGLVVPLVFEEEVIGVLTLGQEKVRVKF